MFQPEIIAKSRKATSTFSTAGRTVTQIGGLPVHAGKGVIHGVAGVFGRKHEKERESLPELPVGQASQPAGQPDLPEVGAATAFPASPTDGGSQEPGTLHVTVLGAKDLSASDSKPYVAIRLGDKEYKTKHTGKTANPEWCALLCCSC